MTLGYTTPVVETAPSHVLVYDRGGKQAVLTDASSVKAQLELNSAILTGSIGRTGDFLLITDEQGYRTAAAVYSVKGRGAVQVQHLGAVSGFGRTLPRRPDGRARRL